MKIKLLNSGDFEGLSKLNFPVIVQAEQLYSGFVVTREEFQKIIPPHRHRSLIKEYVFFPSEAEVVEE